MTKTTDSIFRLFITLENDVNKAIERIVESNDDNFGFNARSYLRAYASWVEGSIFLYKEIVRGVNNSVWISNLPLEYQLYMAEHDWKISGNGIPTKSNKKIRPKDNLKALFVVMSEIFDGFKVETDRGGWDDVMFFYRIRDKMMHPSEPNSLDVSPRDIQRCETGRKWLQSELKKLNTKLVEKLDKDGM